MSLRVQVQAEVVAGITVSPLMNINVPSGSERIASEAYDFASDAINML
jgi:hypothetical protein